MKTIFGIFTGVIFLCVLSACGVDGDRTSPLDAPSGEGVTRTTMLPQVIAIFSPRMCTATLIGDKVAITAAHCLKGAKVMASFQNRKIVTTKYVNLGPGEKFDPHDIGLIYFDKSMLEGTGLKPLALANDVAPGEVVTFLGYGCNQRAMGTHRLYRIRDYLEFLWSQPAPTKTRINGPSNRAQTCAGDSGSPALVQRNGEYQVAGVLHGLLHDSTSETFSVFSDVSRGPNREFIDRSLTP